MRIRLPMLPRRSHIRHGVAVAIVGVCACASPHVSADDSLLLAEDFEKQRDDGLYGLLMEEETVVIGQYIGSGRSRGLLTNYHGQADGSQRTIVTQPLERSVRECTLSYDVQFRPGFQFVNGGRLHGLGPDDRFTGEDSENPDAWCVRVRFRGDANLQTSLFHRDQRTPDGDRGTKLKDYPLLPGRWYSVSLHMRLNEPGMSDGFTRLYVNGVLVEERNDIRFRDAGGDETEIRHFLFNTFHEGGTRASAPRSPDGEFATCQAVFDEITVHAGEHVRVSSFGE
jgi:hypothetical protein